MEIKNTYKPLDDWITSHMNFNNTGLGIFYEFSDDLKLGLEIRQETFYQEFTDDEFEYKQQPNFMTVSAAVRYSFNVWKYIFSFVQLTAGANRGGLVARPMIGLEYKPYPDIAFLVGFEYSYLYFKQEPDYFGANKLGLNYGVSFSF